MNKDYGTFSLAELKAELKKRNAKLSGKKATLVARLQDYDKHSNFNNSPVVEEVFEMFIPEHNLFADINSNSYIPLLTQECFDNFGMGHTKNKAKSQNMYEEKYLLSVRSAVYCGDTYILGRCASEYRKSVVYIVHVKYTNNLILETQCECAAGSGPDAHCKHVFVVLRGLVAFGISKVIRVRDTCTSLLQNFHVPKKYHGIPVEARKLKLRKKQVSQELLANFDPRPVTMRKDVGYKSIFRGLRITKM